MPLLGVIGRRRTRHQCANFRKYRPGPPHPIRPSATFPACAGKALPLQSPAPSRQFRQFAGQRIGPLRDVAGAEADDVVAGLGEALDQTRQLVGRRQRDRIAVAVRVDRR